MSAILLSYDRYGSKTCIASRAGTIDMNEIHQFKEPHKGVASVASYDSCHMSIAIPAVQTKPRY